MAHNALAAILSLEARMLGKKISDLDLTAWGSSVRASCRKIAVS